jgi:hypothetical protein
MLGLFILTLAAILGGGVMFFDAAISAEHYTTMLVALVFTYFVAVIFNSLIKHKYSTE